MLPPPSSPVSSSLEARHSSYPLPPPLGDFSLSLLECSSFHGLNLNFIKFNFFLRELSLSPESLVRDPLLPELVRVEVHVVLGRVQHVRDAQAVQVPAFGTKKTREKRTNRI